jgi:hypothetical protein
LVTQIFLQNWQVSCHYCAKFCNIQVVIQIYPINFICRLLPPLEKWMHPDLSKMQLTLLQKIHKPFSCVTFRL